MPKVGVIPRELGPVAQQAERLKERQAEFDEEALISIEIQARDAKWDTPEQWDAFADDLLIQIREIEGQLSDPTIRSDDYWRWRKKARFSWLTKSAQYRAAKKKAHALRQARAVQRLRLEAGTPDDMLWTLMAVMKRWARDYEIEMNPRELRLAGLIQAHFEVLRTPSPDGRTPATGGFASNAKLSGTEYLERMGPARDPAGVE